MKLELTKEELEFLLLVIGSLTFSIADEKSFEQSALAKSAYDKIKKANT